MTSCKKILEALKADIEAHSGETVEPLSGDKWLLSSCLQKAIRRNETITACRAALSIWTQDRQSFWRRIHLAAIEDIGAADPETVVKVLMATASTAWRRQVGDLKVGLFLTRLLCGSIKNRMADELFIQAERDRGYGDFRGRLAKADDKLLADYAGHRNSPLIERSLALWYLAGTRKFPSDVMPGRIGSPEKAVQVLRGLDAPADLVQSCISVMGRTSWPLSVFMPLIWQEVSKQPRPLYIFYNPIAPARDVEGIPVYAADMFTRTGQASVQELRRETPELKAFSVKQLSLALFYIEGCKVDKILTSDILEQFRHNAEFTDAESVGLDAPSFLGLRECIEANMQKLNDIRQKKIKRVLDGGGHE